MWKRNLKNIPFMVIPEWLRHLSIKLIKEVKYLYIDNYNTLMKEIEEDTNNWKGIPCSWMERIDIVNRISILNVISVKMSFFTKIEKIKPKI